MRQSKAVVKARYLRLSEISAQMLTTEGDNANDKYRMGRDIPTFKEQTAKSQARSKIAIAIIWGYYTAAVIANFSIINLALKILQVGFALVMGSIDYITTTGYVTNELIAEANDFDRDQVKADAEAYTLSEELEAVDVEEIQAHLFDQAVSD